MSSESQAVRSFLHKVQSIALRYEGVAHREQYSFNILSTLRSDSDEKNLHSAILYEFLNPKGAHGFKRLFLDLFLKQLQKSDTQQDVSDLFSSGASIDAYKEYYHPKNGFVDLYFKQGDQALIVENKIYADDGDEQLSRYCDIAKAEGAEDIFVVYLTLDGHEPDASKQKGFSDAILLSYENDINSWLQQCIKEMALYPTTRETLVLYQRIILKLCGKSLNKEAIMEVTKLILKSHENYQAALDTEEALINTQIEIHYSFWSELEKVLTGPGKKRIREDAIMLDNKVGQKYSEKKVRNYYTMQRNRPWFGIKINLGKFKGGEKNICFYVEVEWFLYYGFIVQNEKGDRIEDCKKLADLFAKNDYAKGAKWPAWKHFDDGKGLAFINFRKAEELKKLLTKKDREPYVTAFAEEIKSALSEGVDQMKKENILTNVIDIWE